MSLNNYSPEQLTEYLLNQKINTDNPIADEKVIKDLIQKHDESNEKKSMQDGLNYYSVKNDILNRTITYIVDGMEKIDRNKANNRIPHDFFGVLVDQKITYLVGKPIKFANDDKTFSDEVNDYLGDKFDDIAQELVKNVSCEGKTWIHPFININGEFDYMVVDAKECIPIYDTSTQSVLLNMIRYYSIQYVDRNGQESTRYKVEVWDNEKTTYYMQDERGNYYFDTDEPINPRFHWYSINTSSKEAKAHSWGRVPFVKVVNNLEETSDLSRVKDLIDAYDLCRSDFQNNLADIQDFVWKLKGYEGESLSEFVNNLKSKKVVVVSEDGDVDKMSFELPYQARDSQLNGLKEDIFTFGRGINVSTDKFGQNPTGVALKFIYSLLDLKSDMTERKLRRALRDFLWFIVEFINKTQNRSFNYKDIKMTFNRTMITNETEAITNVSNSNGIVSKKTMLEHHPFVDNVDDEIHRLDDEGNAYLDDTGGGQ